MINKFKQKGFTVLESLVAITVLSLTISGAFASVQTSLSQSIMAKDEVRAFYLAQEAVEFIRNKRDANQLLRINGNDRSISWLAGISRVVGDPCYFGKVCTVDIINNRLDYCGVSWEDCYNNGQYLKQDQTNFRYQYSTGNNTNFKRSVMLEEISSTEIAVVVRVYWTKGLITRDFKFKTHLLNWVP